MRTELAGRECPAASWRLELQQAFGRQIMQVFLHG
jgi:hypothetical protein